MVRFSLIIVIGILFSCSFTTGFKAQSANGFSGKFSSEGDIDAPGLLLLELSQQGSKLEGLGYYKSNKNDDTAGSLSVNGYVKGNKGFIRFRDQKGNTVADGSIVLKDATTVYFLQTTRSAMLPNAAYVYKLKEDLPVQKPKNTRSYSGTYSNEGDVTAKGIISFEISQSGTKIEGTANYSTKDEQLDTGLLSVNGYVKDGTAYIRFRDQKGISIADGTLSSSGKNTIFKQTTSSSSLPSEAVIYR